MARFADGDQQTELNQTLPNRRGDLVGISPRSETRVPGLSHDIVRVILGIAIFVQLRLVTDGRTDTR